MTRALGAAERLDWLRLIRTENVGPITFHALLRRFGTAAAAIDALPGLSRRGGRGKPVRVVDRRDAEREVAALTAVGGRLIAMCEPDYPPALAAIEDAPPVISVLGDAGLLNRPCVGMVGARNASAIGMKFARGLANALGKADMTVVSGLARGIDAAAHTGALERGTVAVVAGGVDVVYPPEHQALQQDIAARGCIVAEQPFGTRPQARHFPRRNRIISGLSLGTVVVEAAKRSGSLITARLAGEQGREVFAVPGSPLDPRCHGTNNLIREGAVLTETVDDIMNVLAPRMTRPLQPSADGPYGDGLADIPADDSLEPVRDRIVSLLSPTPVAVDELIRECEVTPSEANAVLLELELAGKVARTPGNMVALATDIENPNDFV